LTRTSLTTDALADTATITDPRAIKSRLDDLRPLVYIDGMALPMRLERRDSVVDNGPCVVARGVVRRHARGALIQPAGSFRSFQ
jgi:hypothetical protein